MLLKNKVVFITGAASGIGRECALACSREGASVAIADIDHEQARKTAASPTTSPRGQYPRAWMLSR